MFPSSRENRFQSGALAWAHLHENRADRDTSQSMKAVRQVSYAAFTGSDETALR